MRNAFSHGRLNMVNIDGECVFVIEDISPKCKKGKHLVSARMILKKSTLLKWIDIIERGETEYIPKKKERKIRSFFVLCVSISPESPSVCRSRRGWVLRL